MEATVRSEAWPTGLAPVTLGALMRAWNARGAALPVAVVAAIFDDALSGPDLRFGAGPLDSDGLVISAHGFGAFEAGLPAPDPGQLAGVLEQALRDGSDDDSSIPGPARCLLNRLTSDDPTERPVDAEQLRSWIRESLGAPADRDEVRSLVQGVSSLSAEVLPIPEAVDDDELETLPPLRRSEAVVASEGPHVIERPAELEPEPYAVEVDHGSVVAEGSGRASFLTELSDLFRRSNRPDAAPTEIAVGHGLDEIASRPTEIGITTDVLPRREESHAVDAAAESRKVVRYPAPRERPVSLNMAPAARKSARSSSPSQDSLLLPTERSQTWWAWVAVAVVVGGVVYAFVLS